MYNSITMVRRMSVDDVPELDGYQSSGSLTTSWSRVVRNDETESVVPTSLLHTAITGTTDWQLSVDLEGWA